MISPSRKFSDARRLRFHRSQSAKIMAATRTFAGDGSWSGGLATRWDAAAGHRSQAGRLKTKLPAASRISSVVIELSLHLAPLIPKER